MDDQLSSVLYSYAFIKNYLWPLSSLLYKFPTNGHQRCNTRDRSVSTTNSIPRVIHENDSFCHEFQFPFHFCRSTNSGAIFFCHGYFSLLRPGGRCLTPVSSWGGFIRVASKVTRERTAGVLLGILGGGVPHCFSKSRPYFTPMPFSHPFSDLASEKLSSLLRLERQQKFSYFSLFLIHWGLKR